MDPSVPRGARSGVGDRLRFGRGLGQWVWHGLAEVGQNTHLRSAGRGVGIRPADLAVMVHFFDVVQHQQNPWCRVNHGMAGAFACLFGMCLAGLV